MATETCCVCGKSSWLSDQGVLGLQALEGYPDPSPYPPLSYKTLMQIADLIKSKPFNYKFKKPRLRIHTKMLLDNHATLPFYFKVSSQKK